MNRDRSRPESGRICISFHPRLTPKLSLQSNNNPEKETSEAFPPTPSNTYIYPTFLKEPHQWGEDRSLYFTLYVPGMRADVIENTEFWGRSVPRNGYNALNPSLFSLFPSSQAFPCLLSSLPIALAMSAYDHSRVQQFIGAVAYSWHPRS
jgi:hypothetical protein